MFNNIKTKYLVISFVVLLVLALVTIPTRNKRNISTFKSELTNIDTANVKSFTIYPKAGGEPITLDKKENNWWISDKNGEYNADNNQVKNMLNTLSNLKAKRLAAKSKDSWKKYELTDSLGTRIKVMSEKKTLADIFIGKFSYSQPAQQANPYQRQQGVLTSFVRLTDEKEVYAVDGYLSMTFNRQLKDYRDNSVLQVQNMKPESISFITPNQSFTLTKKDEKWLADGLIADSSAVADYLSGLNNVRSSNFITADNKPVGAPNYTLKIAGENGIELATINTYYSDSTNIIMTSSMNPETYFDGTKANLFTKLFKEKSEFFRP